jgi:hypothetical protein
LQSNVPFEIVVLKWGAFFHISRNSVFFVGSICSLFFAFVVDCSSHGICWGGLCQCEFGFGG